MRKYNIRTWGETTLLWCGYADEIAPFFAFTCINAAAELFIDSTFTNFVLSINALKTEKKISININQDQYLDSIISLPGKQLKNVKEFKYLEAVLNYLQPCTGKQNLINKFNLQMQNSPKCLTYYKTSKSTYVFVSSSFN